MKISSIEFKNVRGFKTLRINDLSNYNVLITGNNGNGKTTFLRALSLAFCDEMGAAGLLSELPGQFITFDQSEASIAVELENDKNEKIKIETKVKERFGTEQVRKFYSTWESDTWVTKTEDDLASLDELPHAGLFAVGYGTCLRILGKERYNNYYTADANYSLFKIDTFLQEQELVFRRLLDRAQEKSANKERTVKKAIKDLLVKVLNYPEGSTIRLDANGIFFGRNRKYPSELTTKGDGVRAVATMVLDLMSWWYLYLNDHNLLSHSNYYDPTKVKGIVIIDEVALYLHPSWQKNIIGDLISAFPNVQFILSTHAPLAVSGAADYEDNIKFFKLNKTDGYSSASAYNMSPGATANDVLTSEAFGLATTVSPNTESILRQIDSEVSSQKDPDTKTVLFDWIESISDNKPETVIDNLDNILDSTTGMTQEKYLELLKSRFSVSISDSATTDGLLITLDDGKSLTIPDLRNVPWDVWVELRTNFTTDLVRSLSTKRLK